MTTRQVGDVVQGCIEDMDSESFPDLVIRSYGSLDDLVSDIQTKKGAFETDLEMAPLSKPARKR